MILVKVLCVLDLKLPEKTGCRQPGSSLTALTKSPLSGADILWDSSYGGCVSSRPSTRCLCSSTASQTAACLRCIAHRSYHNGPAGCKCFRRCSTPSRTVTLTDSLQVLRFEMLSAWILWHVRSGHRYKSGSLTANI